MMNVDEDQHQRYECALLKFEGPNVVKDVIDSMHLIFLGIDITGYIMMVGQELTSN